MHIEQKYQESQAAKAGIDYAGEIAAEGAWRSGMGLRPEGS